MDTANNPNLAAIAPLSSVSVSVIAGLAHSEYVGLAAAGLKS
jgi:hypothetical protein